MNTKRLFRNTFFLILLISMAACGTSDTVTVVQDRPGTATSDDAAEADTDELFQEITIGLTDSVENFDPLFADNLSTMRVLSLIYDGLFTLDQSGAVVPAIADDVTVSDDGLEYRIQIKSDLFFHDGSAFQSGIGRRLQASDVKWALERTAKAGVPAAASELLNNIEGYRSYALEQRLLFEERKRVLDEVSGIVVENPQTLVFFLEEPDEEFTRKLASPYLFIYPREAIETTGEGLSRSPVGTGSYTFTERTDSGNITLSLDNSEHAENRINEPRVNRIDFVTGNEERTLFQQFARGDIHWIPEIGPQISLQITDGDGNLKSTYENEYGITQTEAIRSVFFYFNETNHVNLSWLKDRLYSADLSMLNINASFELGEEQQEVENNSEPDSTYLITYTDDIYVRTFLSQIQSEFIEPDASFNLYEIRVPTRETAMYIMSSDSFHDSLIERNSDYWVKMNIAITGIYLPAISGIENSAVPWKLFMEPVRVPEQD